MINLNNNPTYHALVERVRAAMQRRVACFTAAPVRLVAAVIVALVVYVFAGRIRA